MVDDAGEPELGVGLVATEMVGSGPPRTCCGIRISIGNQNKKSNPIQLEPRRQGTTVSKESAWRESSAAAAEKRLNRQLLGAGSDRSGLLLLLAAPPAGRPGMEMSDGARKSCWPDRVSVAPCLTAGRLMASEEGDTSGWAGLEIKRVLGMGIGGNRMRERG